MKATALKRLEVTKRNVPRYIIELGNIYGAFGGTSQLQNYRSEANEPVHKAMKASFQSSIGIQHI